VSLVTKLAAAESALLALMQADASLGAADPAIPVSLGDPGAGVRSGHVWIGDDAEVTWEPDVTMVAAPTTDEIFVLRVLCLYAIKGNNTTGLRDQCMALAAAVTRIVADNRTLSGSVDDCYVTRIQRDVGATAGGRAMIIEVGVRCRSSLA
jgi:hypothetical protein